MNKKLKEYFDKQRNNRTGITMTKRQIKKVQFRDGVKNKQVIPLDQVDGVTIYMLKTEYIHLVKLDYYLINPMIDVDGVLVFLHNNYAYFTGNIKNSAKLEKQYLEFNLKQRAE